MAFALQRGQGPAVGGKGSCRRSFRCRQHVARASEPAQDPQTAPDLVSEVDPDARLRRFGRDFGKVFKIDSWFDSAPRVRVRTAAQRQKDELLELAVLNERLAGVVNPWEARRKLEYIKMRRRNWEHIYNYVTKHEAAATLSLIEEANQKVEELLSEEARETTSVSELKQQLQELQFQVADASEQLRLTQERVSENLEKVAALKAEAATLESLQSTPLPAGTAAPASELVSSSSSISRAALQRQATAAAASSRGTTATAAAAAGVATRGMVAAAGRSATLAPPTSTTAAPSAGQRRSSSASSSSGAPSASSSSRQRVDRGLRSSMDAEEPLKNFWYPAEFSSKLTADTLVPFELFNEPWVLFRDEDGRPSCVRDECAHRACPLSLGKVVEGHVQCAYHGWEFAGDGTCTKMPSTVHCRNVAVAALPCVEKDGFIWVWPGQGEPPEVPATLPPAGYDIHAEICLEVPVEHGLLMENLLDLAHAPFTHTSTFARGWPVPDFVKFHANKMLSGNWDPYPINMSFQPPCMVVSLIGLAQPGKIMRGVTANMCERHLHQLHVCMPSRRGHTRLLYRMSLDFMGWVRYVPGILNVWKSVAGQVLGEDLVLVAGQQDRLERGGDTWANPVSYDKLAVRYRRWRNSVAACGEGAESSMECDVEAFNGAPISMSAGELFRLEDDAEVFVDRQ